MQIPLEVNTSTKLFEKKITKLCKTDEPEMMISFLEKKSQILSGKQAKYWACQTLYQYK